MTALIPANPEGQPLTPARAGKLLAAFLNGLSQRTRLVYASNLNRVARFASTHNPLVFTSPAADVFTDAFMRGGPGEANLLAHEFKTHGTGKGWSASYVNNHLAALRSLVKFFRLSGKVTWTIDVEDTPAEPYRDTKGPGMDGMVSMIRAAREQADEALAARDVALLSLLATMGLRRDEILSLDLAHVDLAGRRVSVKRKRKRQRVWLTVPKQTGEALKRWLSARESESAAVFTSCFADRKPNKGERLAPSSFNKRVAALAKAAGLPKTHPHAWRHAAITGVLDSTNGNIRAAQRFAGHTNPAVTMRYDDNRQDIAGEMAGKLADEIQRALDK